MTPAPLTSFYALTREPAFLLIASWGAAEHLHYRIAAAFYERLFERLPQVRSMFPKDLVVHLARFVSMISLAMAHLDRPDHVREICLDAGRSYARAGFRDAHYPIAASALRAALADVLEGSYSHEHDAAWETLCAAVIRTMLEGARAEP